jgi:hypothetical protein
MKTRLTSPRRSSAGYALLMVLAIAAVSILILSATMNRMFTSANLNSRNNQYTTGLNAAEAATEKVLARMRYDFLNYGVAGVTNNLGIYRTYVPTASEDAYWGSFQFSDGQGNVNQTYVQCISNSVYGPLASQFPGLYAFYPVYRILSNVRQSDGRWNITNAIQEDVTFNSIPVFQFAIFYNGLLEFSTCATMTVNGRVHANAPIYTGTSASLTFNGTVTTTGTISSPGQNGQGPGYTGSWANTGTYNGSPASTTNVPYILLPLGTNNVHAIIDIPPAGESPASALGQQRLYNEAPVVILVSNTTLTVMIRTSINGQVPGADPSPITMTYTNTSNTYLATNGLPFLSTNSFTDKRENDLVKCTQIDVGKYASWIATNSFVTDKFPAGSGTYPTILYVGDQRTYALGSQLTAVRLTNGVVPPANGGLGFSVATFNPMYVLGHYNQTNSAYLGTTNTSSGTVPCALMSDALTILSPNWQDSQSASTYTTRIAANDTVNAAILTGIVPSTGSSSTTFSGGVHNLPRLLEDWNSPSTHTLTLNTSIVNLFNSQMATSQFQNPGVYYDPPTRQFSFDVNFANPAKQPPPGTPMVSVIVPAN